jgi:nucleotide-binding universal stress UspA family protein
MITMRHVLVATDFSEPSEKALTYGRELAVRFGSTLHVLHVVQNIYVGLFGADNYAVMAPQLQQQIEDDARRRLKAFLADGERSRPVTVPVIVTSSAPAAAIVDYAKTYAIDLIVMGTHGRGAIAHALMGSVAERVVRMAACPVLTVHHPEHEFVRPDALEVVAQA